MSPLSKLPEASILTSDAPLGSRRPTDRRVFMFVESQSDNPQAAACGRRERVFVHKRFHQKKKQASIDRLKSQFSSNRVSQNDNESQGAAADAEKPTLIQARYRKVSLTAYPSQRYGDPFSASAMPMTGKLWMYLHHYRFHIVSCSYPFLAPQMQIWWVRKALASPAILQACACTAAEHKALLEYNQGVSSDIIQKSIKDSIYLRIEAIKSLNDLLQDPVRSATQSTVLHVNVLMANEALGAHFEVLQAHKEGLKTLVSMMGGLIELEHPMLSTIYQGSLLLAALQNTKPIFPIIAKYRDAIVHEPQMFHNEDIKYDCVVPATLECLGARFTTASWNVEIHPTMKSLIETFRRLVRHFEIGTLFPSIVAPTDNDLFVIFQHELLTTHYASESPCNPNLDECLRHSLLIYLYIRVSHLQELPIMQNMVENFRHSLSGLSYLYTTAPDLLFWILFIGGMASQGYSSHPWFMSHIAIVAHDLELEDWEQVRTLLGGFFYTDQAGQTAAEDLWTEVLLLAGPYRYIAPKSRILAMEID